MSLEEKRMNSHVELISTKKNGKHNLRQDAIQLSLNWRKKKIKDA